MKTAFPSTTESAIARFEQSLGTSLPPSYRQFLLDHNGGEPINGEFPVEGWGTTLVHVFYGLNTGHKAFDLDWSRAAFDDVLPDSVIPIACDPGGCLICLGILGSARGKVYFWDRGEQLDELQRLSIDFGGFLATLKSG